MMNRFKKTCLTLTSIFLSGSIFAANEKIEWEGGKIAPSKKVSINLEQLAKDTEYNLECLLASNNASHKGKDNIKVITNGKAHVFVNGIDTESTEGYVTMMYPTNGLKAKNIKSDAIIAIYNLEPFNVINIYRCTATPVNAENSLVNFVN